MTAEATIRYINPIVQTGNLHVAIYEVEKGIVYISHSVGSKHSGQKNAYERPYVKIDVTSLFNVPLKISTGVIRGEMEAVQ